MDEITEYSRIRNQIELFEAGKLNLQFLISTLKGALAAIEGANPEWVKAFRAEWWDLEQLNAYALDQKEIGVITDYQAFIEQPANQANILEALNSMKELLSTQGA